MDILNTYSVRLIDEAPTDFLRYLYHEINWKNRLIAITGSRGTGKTTMLKQYAKLNCNYKNGKALYVSLDNIWFSSHTLFDLADEFAKNGGEVLLLDEVHKYQNWSQEIKNIYDYMPSLQVVFTGSSLLKIEKGEADLSRRAATYHLQGMSFREYLSYEHGINIKPLSLDDILANHISIATDFAGQFRPLPLFKEYLRYGYYPYYKEDKQLFHERLLSTVNAVLDIDLPAVYAVETLTIKRIKRLLSIIAEIVPCVPNISDMAQKVETTRVSLMKYLIYLSEAHLVMLMEKKSSGFKQMEKPEKIYLGNSNYCYAFAGDKADIGNVRETFFFNQVRAKYGVAFSSATDFLVDGKYDFEVGGKSKTFEQIKELPNGIVAADDIEVGFGRKIPLYLFGLLY